MTWYCLICAFGCKKKSLYELLHSSFVFIFKYCRIGMKEKGWKSACETDKEMENV